jgi:predicted DNA repair protein MutK
MSVGLLALLDDVAGIAKVAAASIDDVIGHAAKAGAKSAGVVIDDAAVTPRYVTGFAADRELPIVARIARGSLKNKLVYLLPAALVLAFLAPWAITPLLMIGGAYLAYEGAEKVYESVFPHEAHAHEEAVVPVAADPKALEDSKVTGAIRTDFILSAEIMAIALAAIPTGDSVLVKAAVLALVGIAITFGVYGAVALIVKADDVGVALARSGPGPLTRALGRGLVKGMPGFLRALAVVGTAAMIWVGGGIVVHGLEVFGLGWPAHVIHDIAEAAARASPVAPGFVGWLVGAAGSGVFGLALGLVLIPVAEHVLAPLARQGMRLIGRPADGG